MVSLIALPSRLDKRQLASAPSNLRKGAFSRSVAPEIQGRPLGSEFLRFARTVSTIVDPLSSFASRVTRVAREVGTEGKLGGQAVVKAVAARGRP
jgi:hypothetical protein